MTSRDGAQQAERELLRACDSGLDAAALHRQVLRSLRRLMPVDAAFFATADPGTLLFTGAWSEAPLAGASELFMASEFGGTDVNRFTALATAPLPVASLDGTTHDDRWASPRYREIMRPLGLGDELRAALVAGGRCWGYLCLHREDSRLGFSPADVGLIARLGPRIAHGLRGAALLAGSPDAAAGGPPGVLVLSAELEVVAASAAAEELLSTVAGARTGARLPLAVRALAMALRAREADDTAPPPSVRLPTRSGGWLTVHASWLSGPGEERRISVVLAPARPADMVPLLLAAHGLTPREAEVARLVLRGTSTAAIVDTLHISRYTVQDHLRAVFDKVGVRSRRDLAGRLLGQA